MHDMSKPNRKIHLEIEIGVINLNENDLSKLQLPIISSLGEIT